MRLRLRNTVAPKWKVPHVRITYGGLAAGGMAWAATGKVAISVRPPTIINVATPSRNDMFTGEYVGSIYRLLARFQSSGLAYTFTRISYADVEYARNYLVSTFYYNLPRCTHILFVDGRRDLPQRSIRLEKLHSMADMPFEQALARSLEFIGKPKRRAERKDGFVTVNACGAGILLVSRAAIAEVIQRIPSIVRESTHPAIEKFIYAFDKIRDEKEEFSEDISFCKRWTEDCGGKIWASTASPIRHVGNLTLEARYDDLVPGCCLILGCAAAIPCS